MFVQLTPTWPVLVEALDGKPGGKGTAVAVIDYSENHHLIFVVTMDDTGEFWCVPNTRMKAQRNWTMGRPDKELKPLPELKPEMFVDKPRPFCCEECGKDLNRPRVTVYRAPDSATPFCSKKCCKNYEKNLDIPLAKLHP